MENTIYKQAILDAKAVRESAMANAKAAIQEAFEPKIREMIKKSMEESEEEMDENMEDEGYEMGGEYQEEDAGNLDETELDEILRELEGDEEEDETEEELDEAKHTEEDELDEAKEEDESEEEESEEEEGEDETEEGDGTKIVDLTLGDLVDAIKSAMAGEHSEPDGDEAPAAAADDEISLDEILRELEGSEEGELEEYGADAEEMEEAKDKEQKAGHKGNALKAAEKEIAYKTELEEAKKAVAEMQKELNEINLLNAKLLYVNKLFKSKNLSEAQKVKVLNAFDKATTIKEAKTVYNTLSESVEAPKVRKTSLRESVNGFASKPAGSVKNNTIESDPFISRMQKLAGIN